MTVLVASVLDCPAARVWDEVQRPDLLLEVVRPLVRIVPAEGQPFPQRWREGSTVRCRSRLFGIVPTGLRTLFFERIDGAAMEIQTRESEPLIRRWDHLIRVRALAGGQTHYSDEIVIAAGLATPFVWLFANWLYRHRQRRWRQVAKRLAATA